MRGLIKRTPECALHVHVAIPIPRRPSTSRWACARQLPLIGALARQLAVLVRHGLGPGERPLARSSAPIRPRRPAACRDLDEYPRPLDGHRARRGPEDHTMVWWDARLQPRLGTVELRELDVQTGLEQTAGWRPSCMRWRAGPPRTRVAELAPAQALHWSSFRAVRDGLDAELLFRGSLRPARERGALSCWTSCAARTTRSRASSGSCARAARQPASARSRRRRDGRAAARRWPKRPRARYGLAARARPGRARGPAGGGDAA